MIILTFLVNYFLFKFLRQKIKRKDKMNALNLADKANKTENFHKKTLMMVILQCIVMILSRVPDFALSVYKLKLQLLKEQEFSFPLFDLERFYSNLLAEFQSIFLIFTNISFVLNSLIVLFFNRKLKIAFLFFIKKGKFKIFRDNE